MRGLWRVLIWVRVDNKWILVCPPTISLPTLVIWHGVRVLQTRSPLLIAAIAKPVMDESRVFAGFGQWGDIPVILSIVDKLKPGVELTEQSTEYHVVGCLFKVKAPHVGHVLFELGWKAEAELGDGGLSLNSLRSFTVPDAVGLPWQAP